MESLLGRKKSARHGIFANWVDGIIQLNHGKQASDDLEPAVKYFETTHFSFLRIAQGKVIEAYKVPKDFNFNKIPRKAGKKFKALIQEYRLTH